MDDDFVLWEIEMLIAIFDEVMRRLEQPVQKLLALVEDWCAVEACAALPITERDYDVFWREMAV
jgi:hypothetical protein